MSVSPKLSTFKGVFTPTIVTILGVIMYLRQGWLVGNGGLLGAWLVLGICLGITATTALSLSSIATNVRIHAGGAYAIVSRSLGRETGGVVGFMLYLAQSLAITMYIFGFREGWLAVFPTHDPLLIDLMAFAGMVIIVRFFTNLAFQLQYLIFAITILSVLSVSWKPFDARWEEINWVGNFGQSYENFWSVLAVYFPAVTGILAGASLSGDLEDPRDAIPKGTLYAVVVAGFVYAWLSIVYAGVPQSKLLSNYTIMQEISIFPPLIGLAVIGATFCAGLATFVAPPKLMQALSLDDLLPKSSFISNNENSMWITSGIVLLAIFLRDLNSIAPVITICFLTTYGTINLIVLLEQQLGLLSFRPTLKIPNWIPLIGAVGCLMIALIVNPTISLLVLFMLTLGYLRLSRKIHDVEEGDRQDVRTNMFLALARWAAQKSVQNRVVEGKAWMPHPVVPIFSEQMQETPPPLLQLATDLSLPKGSIRLLHLHNKKRQWDLRDSLFIQESQLPMEQPEFALRTALQSLHGTFLQPNMLLLDDTQAQYFDNLNIFWRGCLQLNIGIVYSTSIPHHIDPTDCIHVWIRPQSPHWELSHAQQAGSLDLALLLAIQLSRERNIPVRLVTTLQSPEEHSAAEAYLECIRQLGRLPKETSALAFVGDIWHALAQAPSVTIQIFGMPLNIDETEDSATEFIQQIRSHTVGCCLFIRGSGQENLLA